LKPGLRVLLVDDEPLLVRSFARLLRARGAVTDTAENGQAALEKLATQSFDLVLCDVRMPVMDGPSMLTELRQRGDQTPLVFLTGYADSSEHEMKALGAREVLGKPIDIEMLDRLLSSL
jgi:CheY-like chemotaxis protein